MKEYCDDNNCVYYSFTLIHIMFVHVKQYHWCFHGLCFQYEEGKKRRKSSYSSVDLSEVEWEDKEDEVKCCYL